MTPYETLSFIISVLNLGSRCKMTKSRREVGIISASSLSCIAALKMKAQIIRINRRILYDLKEKGER